MELALHISMILTIMTVSLTGMGESSFFHRSAGSPREPEFNSYPEAEDRFLVNPLNVDDVLSFGPRAPQASSGGFPWRRSAISGPQQSPVDICLCKCESKNYRQLVLQYPKTSRKDGIVVEISNSGHGINLKATREDARLSVAGGILPPGTEYIFDNMHLHWGFDNITGSEHFIDGESFAMECHIVLYDRRYRDVNEALKQKNDSVCVLTILFKVTREDNRGLQNFIQYAPDIRNNGARILVANQDAILWPVAAFQRNKDYLAYPGSLTTSPYTEGVTFLILKNPEHVSDRQLNMLRTLMDNGNPSKPVLSNRRAIQTLNKRPIICVRGGVQAVPREIQPQSNNDVQ